MEISERLSSPMSEGMIEWPIIKLVYIISGTIGGIDILADMSTNILFNLRK